MSVHDEQCNLTGRRRFTKRQALDEKQWWRLSMFHRMSIYHCGSCGGWHVVKAPRRIRSNA